MNTHAVNQAIMASEAQPLTGIKLTVPELFADPGFQEYVNNSSVMTWHDKKGPINPDDMADVVVFVDPSLTGEGTDSDMPYWDVIVEKLKIALGKNTFLWRAQLREHLVVVLTNV
ncbi:TPA: hypothetical protein ACKP9S_003586 [Pseudomonas aeruginosa]